MSVPDSDILGHLEWLLESSVPGSAMHHLVVVSAAGVGPLGVAGPDQLGADVYAIAPVGPVDVEDFIERTIVSAAAEQAGQGRTMMFAALGKEHWSVQAPDVRARRLMAQGRLDEHPDAREVTSVYGACRDGRRWRSRRWLTGPKAGQSEDVVMMVGRPDPGEGGPIGGAAVLLRRMVGLTS